MREILEPLLSDWTDKNELQWKCLPLTRQRRFLINFAWKSSFISINFSVQQNVHWLSFHLEFDSLGMEMLKNNGNKVEMNFWIYANVSAMVSTSMEIWRQMKEEEKHCILMILSFPFAKVCFDLCHPKDIFLESWLIHTQKKYLQHRMSSGKTNLKVWLIWYFD